ncbi:hypothetical protein [Hymenobacter nivis]|uniref:hypothetical protein n=1 Tax=Hymenobacter nivis TaxID=1850093 RepID=UPI0013A57699|nr:hypothetical protein [Hymenobacter nivis]
MSTPRRASDFTARILPAYEDIAVPLEDQRCGSGESLGGEYAACSGSSAAISRSSIRS